MKILLIFLIVYFILTFILFSFLTLTIIKVYYENDNSTQGGWQYVSLWKLIYWLWLGRIIINDEDVYYIRKLKNKNNIRI